jgi:hypothetical protein
VSKTGEVTRPDLLALAGVILGVLGVVAAIGAAWWFGRGPRLVMQVSGTTLISAPKNDHIKVLYDNSEVPKVTQSLIWLWREGRGTVRGTDVISNDPVAVNVPSGTRILDASILAQTKDTNRVKIVRDPITETRAVVAFEYLDPRQGAVIEVLHTGEEPGATTISGTIMGIPKGITRAESGATVFVSVGMAGGAAVTIPTHSIPRSLRISGNSLRNSPILSGGFAGAAENVARLIFRLFSP